jgi:hypothetical protein
VRLLARFEKEGFKLMKSKRLLYGILVIMLLIGGVACLTTSGRPTITQEMNSFDDCAKAGYPILESHPRQCRTPDGRVFVEPVLSEVCTSDQECGEGFYCKHGLCAEFSPDVSCRTDDDCLLINEDLGFSCCWVGACEPIDYSLDKWIAVNKDWFAEQRATDCPPPEECGPAPMCAVRAINENFRAQCMNSVCQKVPK